MNYPRKLMLLWFVFILFFSLGVMKISFHSKLDSLPKNSSIVKDEKIILDAVGGSILVDIFLSDKKGSSSLVTEKTFHKINKFKEWLLQSRGPNELKDISVNITKIYSPLEYLEIYNGGFDNLTDEHIDQFFIESKLNNWPKFLSDDRKTMRVKVRLDAKTTKEFREFKSLVERNKDVFFPNLNLQVTGDLVVGTAATDELSISQIESIILVLLLLFIVLSIMFLSFRTAVVALYPNLITLIMFFGLIGWLGIPVSAFVSLIAVFALGVGIDDTIHYLSEFDENVKKTHNEKESAFKSLFLVGRPMFYTTLVLVTVFGILGFGNEPDQALLGILSACTLLFCFFADVNFLPAIVAHTKFLTLWDYLDLKFDKKVTEEIPVFKGMTLREAKITTLLAYTVDVKVDDDIYIYGQYGDEVYIVIEGQVEMSFVGDSGKVLHQKYIDKGGLFGEIAMFRNEKRVNNVRATADTKLLAINKKVLIRLQKLYPNIALKLFENLARLLGFSMMEADSQLQDVRNNMGEIIKTGVSKVIKDIRRKGVISVAQQHDLNHIIYGKDKLNSQDKKQLESLRSMISSGLVVKDKPLFDNIFQGMNQKEVENFKKNHQMKSFPKSISVFGERDYGDKMVILVSGRLKVERKIQDKKVTVAIIASGDIVGAVSFLNRMSQQISMISTLEDSCLLFVDREGLEKMKKNNSKVAIKFYYNLICLLADRMEHSVNRLIRSKD